MNRVIITGGIVISVLSPLISQAQKKDKTEKKPNVVFFLTDDMGIGDIGCYGQRLFKTPNIDALSKNGMQFMQHYAGATVSGPSRCVLLSGKHTGNSYIRGNKEVKADGYDMEERDGYRMTYNPEIPYSETLISDIFARNGYNAACIGKWGYGTPSSTSSSHPNNRGFKYFYGYISHMEAHYHTPGWVWENDQRVMLNNEVYAPQLFIDKALDFIDKNSGKDEPFFLYYATALPHAGLEIPAQERKPFEGRYQERSFKSSHYASQEMPGAAFAAMITRIDNDVKLLVDKLREKGELDNTIIIFTSDNGTHVEGGHNPYYFDSNGGYRGTKRDLYEGGVRTPLIVQWNNAIPKGAVSYHLSTFWDWMPTFCDMLDVSSPQTDGISMIPELTRNGKKQKTHPHIYYEFYEAGGKQSVLRDGWKLIRLNVLTPDKTYYELYNLNSDPSEQRSVANQYPKKVTELIKIMDAEHSVSDIWKFPFDK